MIYVKGHSAPAVGAVSGARGVRDQLAAFGDDLAGVWVVGQSPERMPGVAALGDQIHEFRPVTARRLAAGVAPSGSGLGGAYARFGGAAALDCSAACAQVFARPTDTDNFGLGLLVYLGEDSLSDTRYLGGNRESGGSYSAANFRRPVVSGAGQPLQWSGLTAVWYSGQADDVVARASIDEPGWYCISIDHAGGASGLRINDRAAVVADAVATSPSLSSVYFGGGSDSDFCGGAVLAALVCDGLLAQNEDRSDQWLDFCQRVLEAAKI